MLDVKFTEKCQREFCINKTSSHLAVKASNFELLCVPLYIKVFTTSNLYF